MGNGRMRTDSATGLGVRIQMIGTCQLLQLEYRPLPAAASCRRIMWSLAGSVTRSVCDVLTACQRRVRVGPELREVTRLICCISYIRAFNGSTADQDRRPSKAVGVGCTNLNVPVRKVSAADA